MTVGTLGNMADTITDEIRDSTIPTQIIDKILEAIDYYDGERFYFNEDQSIVYTTSNSQEFYTSVDWSGIDTIRHIDSVKVQYSGGRFPLRAATWDEMERASTTTTNVGVPTYYAYYQQRLRLYPIPNQAYTIQMAVLQQLATLSLTTQSNAWVVDGFNMIKARAKALIYAHIKDDPQQAQKFEYIADQEYKALKAQTRNRIATGRVRTWSIL